VISKLIGGPVFVETKGIKIIFDTGANGYILFSKEFGFDLFHSLHSIYLRNKIFVSREICGRRRKNN